VEGEIKKPCCTIKGGLWRCRIEGGKKWGGEGRKEVKGAVQVTQNRRKMVRRIGVPCFVLKAPGREHYNEKKRRRRKKANEKGTSSDNELSRQEFVKGKAQAGCVGVRRDTHPASTMNMRNRGKEKKAKRRVDDGVASGGQSFYSDERGRKLCSQIGDRGRSKTKGGLKGRGF